MYKKIKVLGWPGINYVVDVEKGYIAAINSQSLSPLSYTQNCGCNLKRLVILFYKQQLDGTNSALSIDVASSLVSLPNTPQGLYTVKYQLLVKMFLKAGVDCNKEWIWAAYIKTMPI